MRLISILFHYVALTLWNDAPAEIRELPTLDHLKKTTKNASKELDFQTQLPGRTAMLRFDRTVGFYF